MVILLSPMYPRFCPTRALPRGSRYLIIRELGLKTISVTVNFSTVEYGVRAIHAGFPSCLGFGNGGQTYSNFLASTVWLLEPKSSIIRYLDPRGYIRRDPVRHQGHTIREPRTSRRYS